MYENFTDQQILARTAWGENRGGGSIGMQSVMNVVMNRVDDDAFPQDNVRDICLAHLQFDCWMPGTADYDETIAVTENDPVFALALSMASMALEGKLVDITHGATYYFAKSMVHWPKWAIGHTPCADIKGQLFFNDIDD